jgi:hypothetical protein
VDGPHAGPAAEAGLIRKAPAQRDSKNAHPRPGSGINLVVAQPVERLPHEAPILLHFQDTLLAQLAKEEMFFNTAA